MTNWKDPEIQAIRDVLASGRPAPDQPPPTLEESRARLEAFGEMIPLPQGVRCGEATVGGVACQLLTPAAVQGERLVLYFHGGAYVAGNSRSHRPLGGQIAHTVRAACVLPDYRLGPENRFPAAVEDALAVYRAVIAERDPAQVIVAGDSAGGGLTLALALAVKQEGLPQPAGYYVISPWADLTQSSGTYVSKAETDPIIAKAAVDGSAADYLGGADPRQPLASPVFGDFSDLAPMLIQVGSEETLLGDSLKVAEVAGLARVDVRLEIWPEMIHVFQAFFFMSAAARRAISVAGAWMEERLGS